MSRTDSGKPKAASSFGVLKKFLGVDGQDDAASSEAAVKLEAMSSERSRLRGMLTAEANRVAALEAELSAKDAQRVEALTDLRVAPDEAAKARTEKLLAECKALQQEIEDGNAVAEGIRRRINALAPALEELTRSYRTDLGVFLTGLCANLMQQYNASAPELAEIALKIAATHRVMLQYKSGSSNGWNGQIFLPGMIPGEGRSIPPLLDGGSREFEHGAAEHMDAILAELRAAGFTSRID